MSHHTERLKENDSYITCIYGQHKAQRNWKCKGPVHIKEHNVTNTMPHKVEPTQKTTVLTSSNWSHR
jgi:hypothetical protein